jgi:hypothetical protein
MAVAVAEDEDLAAHPDSVPPTFPPQGTLTQLRQQGLPTHMPFGAHENVRMDLAAIHVEDGACAWFVSAISGKGSKRTTNGGRDGRTDGIAIRWRRLTHAHHISEVGRPYLQWMVDKDKVRVRLATCMTQRFAC